MAKTPQPKAVVSGSYRLVPVDDLEPNPKNPNRQSKYTHKKLVQSIKDFGFTDPVIVRRIGSRMQIVGGEHRWRAAQDLGMPEIPVIDLGPIAEHEASRLMIVLNETRGQPDQDALAALIQGIRDEVGEGGLSVLPYSEAQLADFLDEDPVVPVAEDEPVAPQGPVKLKPADLLAVLELRAADQAGLQQLLDGLRTWARSRAPDAPPAWQGLLERLEG